MNRLLILCIFIFLCSNLFAQNIGKIRTIEGNVTILRDGKEIVGRLGFNLNEKDEIITFQKSSCGIVFKDNTMITLDEKTRYVVSSYQYDPKNSKYELKGEVKSGKILFNSGKIPKIASNNVGIKTPTAIIGVKGTKFIVEVDR